MMEQVTFHLAVLVYEERAVRSRRRRWVARSLTTGHEARGWTGDGAYATLVNGVRGMLDAAVRQGQSVREWVRAQRRPDPALVREWRAHRREGHLEVLPKGRGPGGCVIAPRRVLVSAAHAAS